MVKSSYVTNKHTAGIKKNKNKRWSDQSQFFSQTIFQERKIVSQSIHTLAAGRVRVLERVLPAASTQTYSARIVSAGKGRLLKRSMTAGSNADRPVFLVKIPSEAARELEALRWKVAGAKANELEAHAKKAIPVDTFIVNSFCERYLFEDSNFVTLVLSKSK